MVADESANDDYDSAGDEHIVRPRLYLGDTQSCADAQDHQAYNQYNRRFSHFLIFSFLIYEINILVFLVHKILFACITLQTVGMMEGLDLPLRLFGTF